MHDYRTYIDSDETMQIGIATSATASSPSLTHSKEGILPHRNPSGGLTWRSGNRVTDLSPSIAISSSSIPAYPSNTSNINNINNSNSNSSRHHDRAISSPLPTSVNTTTPQDKNVSIISSSPQYAS